MATTYKVLGQSSPAATTPADVYTVPSATTAVISTVNICNRGAAASTFRLAVRPAGATISNEMYLAYDVAIPANDSIALTLGVTMATTDVFTVEASTADFSFNIFGSELT
jgi:hypothetical protein